jgi:hypothetical protein
MGDLIKFPTPEDSEGMTREEYNAAMGALFMAGDIVLSGEFRDGFRACISRPHATSEQIVASDKILGGAMQRFFMRSIIDEFDFDDD